MEDWIIILIRTLNLAITQIYILIVTILLFAQITEIMNGKLMNVRP